MDVKWFSSAVSIFMCSAILAWSAPDCIARSTPGAGVDVDIVQGYRDEFAVHLCPRSFLKCGYRMREDREACYILVEKLGLVRKLLVGNFRISMGTGILYGLDGRFFCSSAFPRPAGAPANVRPTLSLWNNQKGVAALLGGRPFQTCFAIFSVPDLSLPSEDPSVLFWSVSGVADQMYGGIGITTSLGKRGKELLDSKLPIAHLIGNLQRKNLRISCEMDFSDCKTFSLLSLELKRPVSSSLRFLSGPDLREMGSMAELIDSQVSSLRGVVFRARLNKYPLKPSCSYYSTVRRRKTFISKERSVWLAVSGSKRTCFKWGVEAGLTQETRIRIPFTPLPGEIAGITSSEGRLRGHMSMRTGELKQVLRSDLIFGGKGKMPSCASLGVEFAYAYKIIRVNAKITSYSLSPGRPYAISRPGVGSFEGLSLVYGSGTDVAARIGISVLPEWDLSVYYGIPWGKEGRGYIETRWRH